MPGYRRYFETNHVVFVTIVTADRRPWLADARNKSHLIQCLRNIKEANPFRHFAHVILDDHFHWLFQVTSGDSISRAVSRLKLKVYHERKNRNLFCENLWQKRFYDHIIRDERDFRQHMDYIHYNPVKHGYVAMACQWRWSSFHTWVARGNYSKCWGTNEPDGPGLAGEP